MENLWDALEAMGEGSAEGLAVVIIGCLFEAKKSPFTPPFLFRTLTQLAYLVLIYGLSFAVVPGDRPYLLNRPSPRGTRRGSVFRSAFVAAKMAAVMYDVSKDVGGAPEKMYFVYLTGVFFIINEAQDRAWSAFRFMKMQLFCFCAAHVVRAHFYVPVSAHESG